MRPRSHDSSVVQSVERRTVNPYVTGSSPVRGAKFKNPAQGNLSGIFAFRDPLRSPKHAILSWCRCYFSCYEAS